MSELSSAVGKTKHAKAGRTATARWIGFAVSLTAAFGRPLTLLVVYAAESELFSFDSIIQRQREPLVFALSLPPFFAHLWWLRLQERAGAQRYVSR